MNLLPSTNLICPLLDARKNQVYAGLYRSGADGFPEAVLPDRLTDIGLLLKTLAAEEVAFVGDAALLYQKQIGEAGAQALHPPVCRDGRLNAAMVGRIGLRRYQEGKIEDPLDFSPKYLRPSEAEVKKLTY